MRYAMSGAVNLAITTRVEVDFGRDKDHERRAEMMHHIAMLPVVGTVVRLDQSRLDGADILVGPRHQSLLTEVKGIVFPGLKPESGKYANKLADIDHLVGHKLAGRDVFVTDDRGILRRYQQLRDGVGILVMSPAEAVQFVDDHQARHQQRMLGPVRNDTAYRDRRLAGTVSFDYSNNDHRYSIGDGLSLIETQWSKASDRAIHAYRDTPSVEAIALARGVEDIAAITDAAIYDFSSRTRSPSVGQIVVWRNVNGIYAATKIRSIKDDSRGGDRDELSFEFVILPDGGSDFSNRG
ncbi:MAG: hypothetical protein ACOH2M_30545 [Cypionkella sp.]